MLGDAIVFVEGLAGGQWRIGRVGISGGPATFTALRKGRAPAMLAGRRDITYYDGAGYQVRRLSPDLQHEETLARDFICTPLAVAEPVVYCAGVEGLFALQAGAPPRRLVAGSAERLITDVAASANRVVWAVDAGADRVEVRSLPLAPAAASADGRQAERDAAREGELLLLGQRVERRALDVAPQPLDADAAEQRAAAHDLDRLVDGRDRGVRGDGLADQHAGWRLRCLGAKSKLFAISIISRNAICATVSALPSSPSDWISTGLGRAAGHGLARQRRRALRDADVRRHEDRDGDGHDDAPRRVPLAARPAQRDRLVGDEHVRAARSSSSRSRACPACPSRCARSRPAREAAPGRPAPPSRARDPRKARW